MIFFHHRQVFRDNENGPAHFPFHFLLRVAGDSGEVRVGEQNRGVPGNEDVCIPRIFKNGTVAIFTLSGSFGEFAFLTLQFMIALFQLGLGSLFVHLFPARVPDYLKSSKNNKGQETRKVNNRLGRLDLPCCVINRFHDPFAEGSIKLKTGEEDL